MPTLVVKLVKPECLRRALGSGWAYGRPKTSVATHGSMEVGRERRAEADASAASAWNPRPVLQWLCSVIDVQLKADVNAQ